MVSSLAQAVLSMTNALDEDFVLNALLKHNFLPNHTSDRVELPPILNSESFTKPVAEKLAVLKEKRSKHFSGYDVVTYGLTRFNGVARVLSMPHPYPYAKLALTIAKNWKHLKFVSENESSGVIPKRHGDGRIMIMDYESSLSGAEKQLQSSHGKRFVVNTDISNFYPSIYSHSIPWALVGFAEAKKNRGKWQKWYNRLDKDLRRTTRDETNGVVIGPATSSIISEAILARIDDSLRSRFTYYRYIDDYTAFCESFEEAERFVSELSRELTKYKLSLNAGKTHINPLPMMTSSDWIIQLKDSLPSHSPITAYDVVTYMDLAVRVAEHNPGGSVMKYGLKALANSVLSSTSVASSDTVEMFVKYAANLAFHQPALVPLMERLFDKHLALSGRFRYGSELRSIICENARRARSDAVAWGLYLATKYKVTLKDCCYDKILNAGDCVCLLLMYIGGSQAERARVIGFANSLDKQDLYEIDQYWLLLYQLFAEGVVSDPYAANPSQATPFSIMKSEGVSFVDSSVKS